MPRGDWSSLHLPVLRGLLAALLTLIAAAPVAAQDMMPDRTYQEGTRDHTGDYHMHGHGSGIGTGIGIGIGVGIVNELIRQQGAYPDEVKTPSKGKRAARKPESKKPKRAAKKDDKKKQETTDKPPPTKTTDKAPPATPPKQPTGSPPSTPVSPPPPDNPNPTTATNPPANPPGPQQPVAPPGNNNPQPVSPGIQPTGQKEDCPQRGKGCVALLIDFRRHAPETEHGALTSVRRALSSINCDVDYVAPEFTSILDAAKPEEIKKKNDQQMIDIRRTISNHRKKLEEGKELAIEMVVGHGGGWNVGEGNFGDFGVHDGGTTTYGLTERGDSDTKAEAGRGRAVLSRGLFHAGNYKAAFKHVCRWFVWDATCSSGLTPRAVDTLNNTGKAEVHPSADQ